MSDVELRKLLRLKKASSQKTPLNTLSRIKSKKTLGPQGRKQSEEGSVSSSGSLLPTANNSPCSS